MIISQSYKVIAKEGIPAWTSIKIAYADRNYLGIMATELWLIYETYVKINKTKVYTILKGIWALFAIAYLTMLLLGVLQGGFKC